MEPYTVSNADKKANTPAWQGYVSNKKNVKTGKPLYELADHITITEEEWLRIQTTGGGCES